MKCALTAADRLPHSAPDPQRYCLVAMGWGWAGFVWGYGLLWFLVNDRVKLLAYRIFDPVKAEAKIGAEPKLDAAEAMEKAARDNRKDE